MKFFKILMAVVIGLIIGAGAGYLLKDRISALLSSDTDMARVQDMEQKTDTGRADEPGAQGPSGGERKILFYRSPMNPAVTSPVPAKDEMGMDYVPVYEQGAGASDEPSGTVTIDPVVEQNMGVRVGMAGIRKMSRVVRTYGRVDYDQARIVSIHPRFSGWLEKVYVLRQGDFISRGQLLATIYSPELVSTQQDYLLALRGVESMSAATDELPGLRENSEALVMSARRRLKLFGVSKADISRLERTGKVKNSLDIKSPYSGTVIRVRAVEGLAVTPATELYAVADLSTVWIMADVYEPDFPWIRQGDAISVTSAAMPGEGFAGTVEFIYPYEKQGKRTIQVRMSAENKKLLLKPGMFVNVVIETASRTALAVPSEAVLRTGTRSLVFVQREPGKFEPRDVTTGIEASGYTEITKGIKAHEQVVLSGQFLIDSESKLREATLKMISGEKESGMKDMEAMKQQADSGESAATHSTMDMRKSPVEGDSR